MSSSKGKGKDKDKDPASIHPGLKPLDYLNPKIGSMFTRGEGLRYMPTDAFLAWKALPSTKSSTENRPFFIFLHDYGSSSRVFNKVVSKIDDHCLAVDLKGWGRSDDTRDEASRAYSVSQMKHKITRIVSLLQGDKFILVGHGMGAKVAQLYATQQPPNNLVGLLLLAPIPLSSWRPPAGIVEKYRAAYKTGGNLEGFIKRTLTRCPLDETDLHNLVKDGTKETPLAKEAWLTYGMDEDFSHGLGRINVPVVVRCGMEDQVVSTADVLREVWGKVELCLHLPADHCGHLIPLEDNELPRLFDMSGNEFDTLKSAYDPWRMGERLENEASGV